MNKMTKEWKPLISRSCLFETKDDPFLHLNIASSEHLKEINERGVCPECNKSRKFFCYSCYAAVDSIRGKFPLLKVNKYMWLMSFSYYVAEFTPSSSSIRLLPYNNALASD